MAKFRFTGDQETIFSDIQRPDGRTLQAEPGEEFEIGEVTHPLALLHRELEAVDAEAKKLVKAAEAEAKKAGAAVEAAVEEAVAEVKDIVDGDADAAEAETKP